MNINNLKNSSTRLRTKNLGVPIRVLLIEDNPGDAYLIKFLLKESMTAEFQVKNAERLATGLDLLETEDFDVILLDLQLPDSYGFETLETVQQHIFHIPIVLLTGLDDEAFALEAVREGAQDYLVKGKIESDLLVRTLKYAIERKQAEQMIRRRNLELALLNEERHRLSTALEQTAESIIITDSDNRIVYVNPAFEKVTGYTHGEVIGLSPDFLNSKNHDKERYLALQRAIEAGRVWQGRLTGIKKDKTLYIFESTVTPVRDDDGTIVNYVSVQRDVTREMALEEQYRQAQKMEAVGQLAAGIAHDFNNLLTVINGFAALLQTEIDEDDYAQESVERILHAGRRAADLVSKLLAFSREQAITPEIVDLNHVITDITKMLDSMAGEHIDLDIDLNPDLWLTKTDPVQIEQAVINLVVNARDAMPEGGQLSIKTSNVVLDKDNSLDALPGKYIELSVSDTGAGMSDEVKSHIFEPFFTTKEVGQGTGLGLAIVFGIIKQSDGHIQVQSELNQGTTFKIYLPWVNDVPRPAVRPVPQVAPNCGFETILFVEDDTEMRALIKWVLQKYNYKLVEAKNGEDALKIYESRTEPIHMLLTDVVMPGMGGKALAEQLLGKQPQLKVVYMSGYSNDAITHYGVSENGPNFLRKPFTPIDLVNKIRDMFDAQL
ncbi:MAG: response regulator [Anaerolineae bacterium]|nr:response regulator [Anaerolineae bacterium]